MCIRDRYAIEKGCDLLAAFDVNPAIVGKDVSEIIGNDYPEVGVKVSAIQEADRMLGELKPDVCIIATRSTVAEVGNILQYAQNMGAMQLLPVRRHCIHGIRLRH